MKRISLLILICCLLFLLTNFSIAGYETIETEKKITMPFNEIKKYTLEELPKKQNGFFEYMLCFIVMTSTITVGYILLKDSRGAEQ